MPNWEEMIKKAQEKQNASMAPKTAEEKKAFGEYVYDPKTATYQSNVTGETMDQSGYNDRMAAMRKQKEQEAKNAQMAKSGLNPDGSPMAPEYKSMIDPSTGKLKAEFQLNLEQMDPSKLEGYNMIKNLATQKGPSEYANLATQQAGMRRQDAMDAAARQMAGGQAQARAALGMRGGMSSGARERLAAGGARDLLGAKQGAYRAESGQLLDIGMQDEQMKRQALSQFAEGEGKISGQNLALRNQMSQWNTGKQLEDFQGKNAWEMDKYKESLDKWAADKQAQATRSASSGGGGGGCYITTTVCTHLRLPDDNDILNTFRKFRDEYMGGKNSLELQFYYDIAPKIAYNIEGKGRVLRYIYRKYLMPAYRAIKLEQFEEAYNIYKKMVIKLSKKYLEV